MGGAKRAIGQRTDDKWGHCLAPEMTKASFVPLSQIVGALLHCRFPYWPPDNLSSSRLIGSLLHGCLLIQCQLNKSEWRGFHAMRSCRMLFDNALSGKFVRTMRLSVASAIGHGNFVLFSGVLICYCFIMPSRRGRLWKYASGSLF